MLCGQLLALNMQLPDPLCGCLQYKCALLSSMGGTAADLYEHWWPIWALNIDELCESCGLAFWQLVIFRVLVGSCWPCFYWQTLTVSNYLFNSFYWAHWLCIYSDIRYALISVVYFLLFSEHLQVKAKMYEMLTVFRWLNLWGSTMEEEGGSRSCQTFVLN